MCGQTSLMSVLATLTVTLTLTLSASSLPADPSQDARAEGEDAGGSHDLSLASPQAHAPRALSKRDLSLNQDLKTLANLLIAREYERIQHDRRHRDFLRKLGKRAQQPLGHRDSTGSDVSPGSDRGSDWWRGLPCDNCLEQGKVTAQGALPASDWSSSSSSSSLPSSAASSILMRLLASQ